MPYTDYPPTPTIDEDMRFKAIVIETMNEFRAMDPWRPRGHVNQDAVNQRIEKFRWLNARLAEVYGIDIPNLTFDISRTASGKSHYIPSTHTIGMVGRLSVVTFLHEFTHARGFSEQYSVKWSCTLFKKIFPERWGRLNNTRHFVHQEGNGTR